MASYRRVMTVNERRRGRFQIDRHANGIVDTWRRCRKRITAESINYRLSPVECKKEPPSVIAFETEGGSSTIRLSQKSKLVLLVFLVIVFLLLFDLRDRLALSQTGVQIVLRKNLLVDQVLVAIDARGALRLHLRMCSLG